MITMSAGRNLPLERCTPVMCLWSSLRAMEVTGVLRMYVVLWRMLILTRASRIYIYISAKIMDSRERAEGIEIRF